MAYIWKGACLINMSKALFKTSYVINFCLHHVNEYEFVLKFLVVRKIITTHSNILLHTYIAIYLFT